MNTAKLLKVLALALLSLVGTACSLEGRDIDPELEPYVLEFEEEFGVHIDIPVRFYHDDIYYGRCANTWPKKEVLISSRTLNEPEYARPFVTRYILFHELAHCELGLDHDDTMVFVDDELVPYSIMHNGTTFEGRSLDVKVDYSVLDWQHYTNELRHKWHNRLESLANPPPF